MALSINHSSSTNKALSYQHKTKTEPIDEYQALAFHKNENFQKMPTFNKPQQDFKRKHCIIKPIKNKTNQVFLKIPNEEVQNCTTEEKSSKNQLGQTKDLRRSGSAVHMRNYLKVNSNKQNLLNQEEKTVSELSPKWKNSVNESVSTVFETRKSLQKPPIKTSHSLVRVRSKQHLMFCASKLPKDFFGESILGDNIMQDRERKTVFGSHGNLTHGNQGESALKKAGCKQFVFGGNKVQKLLFSQQKGKSRFNEQIETTEPEFTFRKQKSKKCLQSGDESILQTPRFSHKRQVTQNVKKIESLPSLHKNTSVFQFIEAKKRVHRNFSKQNLKL